MLHQNSRIEESETQILSNLGSKESIQETLPKLLAWCSRRDNNISLADLETEEEYASFPGVQLKNKDSTFIYQSKVKIINTNKENWSWTHVREIPNTNLLVSLHQSGLKAANLQIFDVSKKRKVRRVYSFEELLGVTGSGDITFNSRRNIMGAMSLGGKIAYHLFNIDAGTSKIGEVAKLCRKSKWHSQYSSLEENRVEGLDFHCNGELVATIDTYGVCLISDINTNNYGFHIQTEGRSLNDPNGCCRWSTNIDESLLFIKHAFELLNILDVEKKTLILKESIEIMKNGAHWIDVCPVNGNLLAVCGGDVSIKIYDRRESEIVKTLSRVHDDHIGCVRWSSSGDMLASASDDTTAKVLDFKTEKIIYTGNTLDTSK